LEFAARFAELALSVSRCLRFAPIERNPSGIAFVEWAI
jgi:hypothetical protein